MPRSSQTKVTEREGFGKKSNATQAVRFRERGVLTTQAVCFGKRGAPAV